jgi:hypothetical protein
MLLLAAAIAVSASFDGGSVGRVEQVAPDHLRCAVKGQADQNNRNRQANWYYFRLDNLPRRQVTIDFTDLVGEYNFRPGTHSVTKNSRPLFSYDDRAWTHFTDAQMSWDEKEVRLTVRFTPTRSTMWIAHTAPYGKRELDALLARRSPYVRQGVVGRTVHGRKIPLLTVTDFSVPDAGKKVVWLMARQHAWECPTSFVADGAVRYLTSSDAEATRIRRSTVFQIIPLFDMDGAAEGAVRFNANGYDNNRNWDTADEKNMPEIWSVRKSLLDWLDGGRRIDVFLAMHDTESTDYVDGPALDPKIKPVADDLVARLREWTDFYDPRSPRNSMAGNIDKGRYTVNQYLYKERQLPAFLMELMVEGHPQKHRPRTTEEFVTFGAGLARSLAAAAQR